MAIQQPTRINFGSGRLYAQPPGALYPFAYPDLMEANVSFKIDTKDAFAEGAYPVAVATGHKSVEIAAKHYTWTLDALANDFSLSAGITAGANPWAVDEVGTFVGSNYTLANASTYLPGTLAAYVTQTSAGFTWLQQYAVVSSGFEVVGKALSVSSGTLHLNASDPATTVKATYSFSTTSANQFGYITGINTFQNSDNIFKLRLFHQDRSPIDNSLAETIWSFNAVKLTDFKAPYKEGEWTVIERSFKAFADYNGNVWTCEWASK